MSRLDDLRGPAGAPPRDVVALPAPLPEGPRLLRREDELWSTGWPRLDRELLALGASLGRLFVFEDAPIEPGRILRPTGVSWVPAGLEFHEGFAGLNARARLGSVGGYAYELRTRQRRLLHVESAEDVAQFQAAYGAPEGRYDWGAVADAWGGVVVSCLPSEFGLRASGGWVWDPSAVRAVEVIHEPSLDRGRAGSARARLAG